MAHAPSIGPKNFVSKVWLVGCLNFSHEVTKTYQAKKLGIDGPGMRKSQNVPFFKILK